MKTMKREVFENVWDALEDTPEKAEKMKVRSELMIQIEDIIKKNEWTKDEAAKRCKVTQSRIDELMRGKIDKFSLNALISMAATLGCRVHVKLQ